MRVGFTKSDWLAVTVLYRSNNVDELRRAVAILHTWRVRMGNSLHVAAEMTEVLLSAIVSDKETNADDWLFEFNLRLLYSTAVIRFVNYVNELCQRRNPARTMSVKEAVSMMNMPPWVVQVRHEATHQHLPTLQRLRQATEWCRDWLWHNHWEMSIDEAMSSEEEQQAAFATITVKIVRGISEYVRYRMTNPNDELLPDTKRANCVIRNLAAMLVAHTDDFIDAFLSDGFLIMTQKQLEVADMGRRKSTPQKTWSVPATVQLFWRPLFSLLSRSKALPALLHELIEQSTLTNMPHVRRKQLIGWADRLLDAFLESQQLSVQDWKRLMRGILENEECFNKASVQTIAAKITSMSKFKRRSLEMLISMSPAGPKRKRPPVEDIEEDPIQKSRKRRKSYIKTVEDLRLLKLSRMEGVTRENAWMPCDSSEWKGIPLGLTPEQRSDTLMLVIDSATFVPRVPCS